MVLPTTPFGKALVLWATGKRLTNRLPELRLRTRALFSKTDSRLLHSSGRPGVYVYFRFCRAHRVHGDALRQGL